MNNIKVNWKSVLSYILTGFKWIILAIVIGVVGGVVGSLFHHCVDFVTEIRQHNWWLILLLPAGGVTITALYRLSKNFGKIDTNRVIDSVNGDESVPMIMTPLIFVGTVITHLLGGSAGREGAALQLGGSLGYNTGKLFKLDKPDKHTMVMMGMSSVFAALFGTPLTASIFAIEVTSVGKVRFHALLPGLVSAVSSYLIAQHVFGISPVMFDVVLQGEAEFMLFKVAVLALLCALVSIVFCLAIKYAEKGFEKIFPNAYLRSLVGGMVIVLLTFVVGVRDYNGAGMDIIENAVLGNAKYEAFLWKIIFTAITIAAGFKGGEIVPTFFIGATFGCVAGGMLGMNPSLGAAIGIVAMFCGVTNCPVASMFLAAELFNDQGLIYFALTCALSFVFSGYWGLYKSQIFEYSKVKDVILK